MKFLSSLLLLTSLSLPAFAIETRGDCFMKSGVSNFQSNSPVDLTVRSMGSQYKLNIAYCSELPWANAIAFDSFGNRVCAGDRVLVLDVFTNRVIQSCYIFDITKI